MQSTAPRPVRPIKEKYAVGRFVAGFIIGLGSIAMLLGVLFLGLGLAALLGKTVALPESVPKFEVVQAAAMLAGGLVVIFIGQLAQAAFDGANAMRALANRDGH